MEDYSQLPEEIVEKITTEHLDNISQLIAFSGVRTSWRSAALDSYNRRRQRQVPFLPGFLISKTSCTYHHGNYEEDSNCRRQPHHQFRPISTVFNGVDSLVKPPRRWSPPDFQTRRRMHLLGLVDSSDHPNSTVAAVDLEKWHCIASRDGWLVLASPAIRSFTDTSSLKICLLNPVTGASISLPPLLHDQFKFDYGYTVLSSSPDYDDDDCHVILTQGHCGVISSSPQVAWCKVRGGCWKFTSNDFKLFYIVECATYFGGKLYVADRADYVHVFSNLLTEETNPPSFTVRSFLFSSAMLSPYRRINYGDDWTFYDLFELNGELIVILRHCDCGSVTVQVYKLALVQASSDHSWEEVKSLDGYAVFLGTHQSLCVALQNDEIVKRNHIYYLNYSCGHCDFDMERCDQHYWVLYSRDCGVYSLEHRKVVEHSRRADLFHDYVWFSPMPWDIRKHMKMRQTGPSVSNKFQALSLLDDSDD